MSGHVLDLLPELLDGALEGASLAEVTAHLAACADCRAERDALAPLWGLLAPPPPPVPAAPALRDRLMADTRTGRLYAVAPALAAFMDLSEAEARALLDRADDPAEWGPFTVPGVRWMKVRGGPAVAHRKNGLIHIPAGTHFPAHLHHAGEHTLVLTGRMRDDDGRVYTSGELAPKRTGTQHSFVAEGPVHLLCGLAFEGTCSWV